MKKSPLEYDLAYGCFAILALVALVLIAIRSSYTDAEWAGGAGAILLLLFPLLIVAFIAMVVGIILSFRLWKHRPLVVLAGSTILLIMDAFVQFVPEAFSKVLGIIYCMGVGAASVWWFLHLRRRQFPRPVPAVKE